MSLLLLFKTVDMVAAVVLLFMPLLTLLLLCVLSSLMILPNHNQSLSAFRLIIDDNRCRRQEPLLFHGTIRENLDPSGECTDAELWQALRRSRLTGPEVRGGDNGGAARAASRNWASGRPSEDGATARAGSTIRVGGSSSGACADGDGGGTRFGLETELKGDAFSMSAGEPDR